MKWHSSKWWWLLAAILACHPTPAAPPRQLVRVPDDIVKLKQLADAGNLHAQLALAKRYAANGQFADSHASYLAAARTGSMDAIYQVGHNLLLGAASPQAEQRVDADPAEGIKWIYRAATNRYPAACADMALALQNGLGLQSNLPQAYAWLILYGDLDRDRGPAAMERFALRMNTDTLLEGKRLAAQFRKSIWPGLQVATTARVLVPLKLTGITMGGSTPLAVINRRTLGAGEATTLPREGGGTVTLRCLEIKKDCVRVEVSGEGAPRWITFDNSVVAVTQP